MTGTPRAKFSPRPTAPLHPRPPQGMCPYHRPHCLALGGRVTSPSSACPVLGEEEAALGRLPLLWVCPPFCPSTCYPLLCLRGPTCLCVCVSSGPMCPCVSPWPWVGPSKVAIPLSPSCCPPVLFISSCCCDHSHAPHSVRGQGTLPGPCAVSHTALQAPTRHPHTVFAVNKRFEDCRTQCCVFDYGMDMSPTQRPFVPFTNAPKLNPASGREAGPIPKGDGEGRKAMLWAVVPAQAGGQLREGQVDGDGRSLGMGSRKGQSLVMLRS